MKRILIIYPHWPPSNLVGVHRVRLIANELEALGWKPTVLTVDEHDHEEQLSAASEQLVKPGMEVIKVRARPVKKIAGKRVIGDIGLRGYKAIKQEAHRLLASKSYDFIWFSVPSYYLTLMGTSLSRRHGVPFGVDYQDPWVYSLSKAQKGLNRATATVLLARLLEPIALRNVALVSGISEGYIEGVRQRNGRLKRLPTPTCQLGFSMRDHQIELPHFKAPFTEGKRTFIYAGAYWQLGAPLFRLWFQGLAQAVNRNAIPADVEFLFVGTNNPELPSITSLIEEFELQKIAREIAVRQPYLEVQQMLRESAGAIVMGSLEAHYSPSKVFQCLVTAPRTMAFFHAESEGKSILEACNAADFYVPFHPATDQQETVALLADALERFVQPHAPWSPDLKALQPHTAEQSAKNLIAGIEQIQ